MCHDGFIFSPFFFSTDAHKALGLLEDYRKKLPPESVELREALTRAIIAIRSRLFQALLGMVIKLILGTGVYFGMCIKPQNGSITIQESQLVGVYCNLQVVHTFSV